MGMNMSFTGEKGPSASQMWNLIINTLYNQFVEKDISDFDAFNVAVLDIFNTINMALHGKHYDAPSHKGVMDLFKQWKEADEEAKKKIFTDFMRKNVNLNRVDESMIVTAIVAPPSAMVAKRTGQTVPQLKHLKAIPDVVFVPAATVLALITVKILKLMFMGKKAAKDAKKSHMHEAPPPASSQPPEPELPPAQPPQGPQEPEPAPAPSQPLGPPSQPREPELAPAQPPQGPQQLEPAPAPPPEHMNKEHPGYCAICKRIH